MKKVLVVDDSALMLLGNVGFDPVYGARPLRRQIQTTIEDQLARRVLAGQITEGSTVTFDGTEDGDLVFNIAAPAEEEDAE